MEEKLAVFNERSKRLVESINARGSEALMTRGEVAQAIEYFSAYVSELVATEELVHVEA